MAGNYLFAPSLSRIAVRLHKMLRGDDQLPAKRHSLRQVETYEIECRDFNRIEEQASGIGTAFASAAACLPVAVTLNIALKTTTIADSTTVMAMYGLMWACYIAGIICAVEAYRKRGSLQRFMQEIRDSQIAPIAAKMPSTEADLTAASDPDATSDGMPSEPVEER